MKRRTSASTLLTVGLLLACLAGAAACLEATVFDAGRVAATSRRLLEAQPVEQAMHRRAVTALAGALPPGAPIDQAGLDGAADDMLREPAFVAAFGDSLAALHRRVFDGGDGGPIVLDPVQVRAAGIAALDRVDPSLPDLVAPGAVMTVSLDTDGVPHASGIADLVAWLAGIAAVVGVGLIVAGAATYEHRARALARIGRWAAVTGIGVLVTFWLLPELLLPRVGGWSEVAGVVMSADRVLVVPGIALTVAGLVLTVFANRLISLQRDHVLAVVPKAPMRHATASDRSWQSRV